jgi:hypothetical protein
MLVVDNESDNHIDQQRIIDQHYRQVRVLRFR